MEVTNVPNLQLIITPNGKFFINIWDADYHYYYQLMKIEELQIVQIGAENTSVEQLLLENFNILTKDAKFYIEEGKPNYIFDEGIK